MNLYHDHGITYNFWGLWILQLSICLNKKGALKTHEKLDWSARQHLNNEFYGHLLSFLLYDFLPTRHFWQWERNSYYSSDNREQREQTGGSDRRMWAGLGSHDSGAQHPLAIIGILLLIWILFPVHSPNIDIPGTAWSAPTLTRQQTQTDGGCGQNFELHSLWFKEKMRVANW